MLHYPTCEPSLVLPIKAIPPPQLLPPAPPPPPSPWPAYRMLCTGTANRLTSWWKSNQICRREPSRSSPSLRTASPFTELPAGVFFSFAPFPGAMSAPAPSASASRASSNASPSAPYTQYVRFKHMAWPKIPYCICEARHLCLVLRDHGASVSLRWMNRHGH